MACHVLCSSNPVQLALCGSLSFSHTSPDSSSVLGSLSVTSLPLLCLLCYLWESDNPRSPSYSVKHSHYHLSGLLKRKGWERYTHSKAWLLPPCVQQRRVLSWTYSPEYPQEIQSLAPASAIPQGKLVILCHAG